MRYHDSRRVAAQKVEVEGSPKVKAEAKVQETKHVLRCCSAAAHRQVKVEVEGSKQKAQGLRLEVGGKG